MVRFLVVFICFSFVQQSLAQQRILWAPEIQIDKSSFRDSPPNLAEDGIQEISLHTTYEFGYQMTNAQFAFTKNFNKYIEAYYIPELSWIEEGELTDDLIGYANLLFDTSELYARKLRKALYEAKKFGSGGDFFQVAASRISNEHIKFQSEINSQLNSGAKWSEVISQYSEKVNSEINTLNEYCQSCKPLKKKKKKK